MDFAEGETVEWTMADKQHLIPSRRVVSADPFKFRKNAAAVSPENSHPNESKVGVAEDTEPNRRGRSAAEPPPMRRTELF